ncbi:uncharacterized protein [Parasteatoda tepidariorum]|uniref:uncharacterized protein n=1 Tax=Parasteatoda tepidariorum TaxID=114398 RepID=UPI00077FC191|nr:uncharacterized protein LOC107442334 [Parasteatoda tepidariorum]XP_015911358.1 uncharacterized protein LOC107442334 [Parasteatoda tepidariorum]
MYAIWIFLVYVLSVTALGPEDLCGTITEEIAGEFDKCNKVDPEYVQKIVKECQLKVVPDEEVKVYPFFTAGCKNNTIFRTFENCMDENRIKMTIWDTALGSACYRNVSIKYDLVWP